MKVKVKVITIMILMIMGRTAEGQAPQSTAIDLQLSLQTWLKDLTKKSCVVLKAHHSRFFNDSIVFIVCMNNRFFSKKKMHPFRRKQAQTLQ